MAEGRLKPLVWIGSSHGDLARMSDAVQDDIGYALYFAQQGLRHTSAKVLRGFGGAGVLEVVTDDAGGTYRGVYTVRLAGAVYVLHVFQKKSKRGVKTPASEIETVRRRLAVAEAHYRERKHEFTTHDDQEDRA